MTLQVCSNHNHQHFLHHQPFLHCLFNHLYLYLHQAQFWFLWTESQEQICHFLISADSMDWAVTSSISSSKMASITPTACASCVQKTWRRLVFCWEKWLRWKMQSSSGQFLTFSNTFMEFTLVSWNHFLVVFLVITTVPRWCDHMYTGHKHNYIVVAIPCNFKSIQHEKSSSPHLQEWLSQEPPSCHRRFPPLW